MNVKSVAWRRRLGVIATSGVTTDTHLVVGDGPPWGPLGRRVPLQGAGEVPGGEAPLQGQVGQEEGHLEGVLEGHLHYDGLCMGERERERHRRRERERERDIGGQGERTPYGFL